MRISEGGEEEKRRPVGPRRWGVRRWRLGEGVVEGVWPRAWDITFVLPKKRLEMLVRIWGWHIAGTRGDGGGGGWIVPAI